MSAVGDRRTVLDALREADRAHDCPAAAYTFVERFGGLAIHCAGCRETIWRE